MAGQTTADKISYRVGFMPAGYSRWGAAGPSESRHWTGYKVGTVSEPNFFWRSPLRHIVVRNFLVIPFL